LPTAPANENNRLARPVTRLIALLALSALINYIDRGNLSIAAHLLKGELDLSASQLGILLSSFFWTYSLFLPVSGWLTDRFEVKWVMAFGFFLWSGATAVTGGLHAFTALLAARLMLGIGESVAYPCYARTLVGHVRELAVDSQMHSSLPELAAARPWARFSGARSWRDTAGAPSSSF